MTERALCFGRFRLDLAQRQLLLDERPLQLGDRALLVLRLLAEANGALVPKEELLTRVWAGQVVEENNLQVQISTLRKALDPEGTGESWIMTVPGRGYRLLGVGHAEPAPAHRGSLPQLAHALIGRTHDLAEVETVCDVVAMVHRGRLLAAAPLTELRDAGPRVEIEVGGGALAGVAALGLERLGAEVRDDRLVAPQEASAEVLRVLLAAGVPIVSLNPARRTLEQAYLEATRA